MGIRDRYVRWITVADRFGLDWELDDGAWSHEIRILCPGNLVGAYVKVRVEDDLTETFTAVSLIESKVLTGHEAQKMLGEWRQR